jgi:hypothetical protein
MTELERKLLSELETEKKALENQILNLTPEVSYDMDKVVRTARKNHLGVFDEPYWPSGHEKVFIPITELWDETVITGIDIDSKDLTPINLTGKYPGIFKLYRMIVRAELKRMGIAKDLNRLARRMVIDGTGIAKVTTRKDKKRKKTVPDIQPVDWFNVFFSYMAESIEDTPVYEDFFPSQSWVQAQDWENKDKVAWQPNVSKDNDRLLTGNDNPDSSPKGVFTECWVTASKQYLTKDEADKDTYIDLHIIVSNLGKSIVENNVEKSAAQIHLIEENPYKNDDGTYDKPYRLFPMREVIGRLPGRGMPEALLDIQLHANLSANWRLYGNIIRNSLIAKYNPATTGLKPGDLNKIGPTGDIPINGRMDDFQFIQMPQAPDSQGEFTQIMDFAQRYVPNVLQGVSTPGEKPTTSLLRNQNAQGIMGQIREDYGINIGELLDTLIAPIIIDNLESELTITGTREELEEYDDAIAELRALSEAELYTKTNGYRPNDMEIESFKEQVKASLSKNGDERPLKITAAMKKKLKDCATSFTFAVTDEQIDKATLVTKLQELFAMSVQNNPAALAGFDPLQLIDQIFAALNIPNAPRKKQMAMANPGAMPMPTSQSTLTGLGNPTSEVANANLPDVAAGEPLTNNVSGAV